MSEEDLMNNPIYEEDVYSTVTLPDELVDVVRYVILGLKRDFSRGTRRIRLAVGSPEMGVWNENDDTFVESKKQELLLEFGVSELDELLPTDY